MLDENTLKRSVSDSSDNRLYDKLNSDDDLKILYLGGSITAGFDGKQYLDKPYPVLFEEYLTKRMTGRNIITKNFGCSAYASVMGLVELVKSEDYRPDIVIVEFAVNNNFDIYNAEQFESLVRRILSYENSPAVIVLNCCREDMSSCEAYMHEIAEHYHQTSISLKSAIEDKNISDYYNDGVHPNSVGHVIISQLLIYAAENAYIGEKKDISDSCCYGNAFENMIFFDNTFSSVKCSGGFESCCVHERFPNGIKHRENTCGSITFNISAQKNNGYISVVFLISSDRRYGKADVMINGKCHAVLDGYSIYGWNNPVFFGVCTEKHTDINVEIRMHKGDENKIFDIAGFGI